MVQSKERAVQMTRSSQTHSGRRCLFALFLLFTRFVHDRMTRCWLRMEAFGPSHRFAPWLARTGRRAKLRQKAGHDPANLPGSHGTPFGFPRQERVASQLTSQRQLDERQHHDPTPPQKLLWRAHVCCRPEQILLEKTQDMLFREAQPIAFGNLFQRHHVIEREKPTDAGITFGITSRVALDPQHAQQEIAILLEMHLIEAGSPSSADLPHRSLPTPLAARFASLGACLARATVLPANELGLRSTTHRTSQTTHRGGAPDNRRLAAENLSMC